MSDIATISLRVDTSELVAGNKALDEFQQTATGAAQKADDLNSCFKAGATSQKQSTASIKEQRQELQNLLNKISPVNRALNDLDDMQAKLRSAQRGGLLPLDDYTRYNQILETTRDKLGRVQRAETAEGRALLEAEAAAARATATRERFIQQLKNQVAAQSLSRAELLRQKAAQLGAGSAAEVYIKKLEQAGEQTHQLGLKSAGARREIGVLIGELARGNLGALRGSGITLANRAGWIDQLLTLRGLGIAGVVGGVTAAVAALGKAWYEGSREGTEFNKQLLLTGNYAGTTAGQLGAMAKALSGNGITQGDAAAALAKIVSTGKFAGKELENVTRTALAMQRSMGTSVEDTAKAFERLREEPSKAAEELNKQLNYLTAEQYEYVAALERSGNKAEAAAASERYYAEEMQKRAREVQANLGVIERSALAVSDVAKGMWDALLGVGREKSLDDKIAEQQKYLESLRNGQTGANQFTPYGGMADVFGSPNNAQIEAAQRQLDLLKQQRDVLQANAKKDGERKQLNKEIIAAEAHFNSLVESQKPKLEQRNAEYERLNKLIAERNKTDKPMTEAEIAQRRAAIEKAYRDPKTQKTQSVRVDAGDRESERAQRDLLTLKAQLKTLEEHRDVTDKISSQRQAYWQTESQYAILQEASQHRQLTLQEQQQLASSKQTLEYRRQAAELGDQIEKQKQRNQLEQQAGRFAEQQAAKRAELQSMAEGKSSREAGRDAERNRVSATYAANPAARDRALKELEETYKKEDDLRSNWLAGAKNAWNEYYESAINVYSSIHDVAEAGLSGLSGMLDDLVTTGKASFKSFATSMLKMIVQITDRLLIAYAVQSALGWTSGNAGGGNTPGGAYANAAANVQFDKGGYTGEGGKYDPAGIVHRGEFVFTKEATSAIGVDNLYAMMKGAQGYANGGYVGKAPMAGLKGGSSAAAVAPVISVSVGDINIGNEGQKNTGSAANAAAIGRQIKDAMVETINTQVRKPGTPLWNAIRGR